MSFLDAQVRSYGARAMAVARDGIYRLFENIRTQSLPPEKMSYDLSSRLQTMQTVYSTLWSLFTGEYWRQVDSKQQDRWKLRLNWTQAACFIHSALWAGEMPSNAEPIMRAHFEPRVKPGGKKVPQVAKDACLYASQLVNEVWGENMSRSSMVDSSTIAQALGGVVYILREEPERLWFQKHPIRIETIRPDHFVAISNASNYWDLLKVWIVREITMEEAKLVYGYRPPPSIKNKDTVKMEEMWTKDEYQVSIEGMIATFNGRPMKGSNPDGFIPVMYFPHIRAGQFIGLPLINQVLGLMEEINEVAQTLGDLINNEVNELPYIRDFTSKRNVVNIAGRRFIDAGSSSQFGHPEIERAATNSQSLGQIGPAYLSYLQATLKEMIATPDVAWGVDPGSQRSGESRQLLFFPLEEHIKIERTHWGDGKSMMDEMIVRMLRRIGGYKLGDQHVGLVKHQKWFPLLPPDREKLVTEMQLRAQAGHVSQETAIQQFGDAQDVEEEIVKIRDFMKKQSEWKPAGMPGQDMPSGNGSSSSKKEKEKAK